MGGVCVQQRTSCHRIVGMWDYGSECFLVAAGFCDPLSCGTRILLPLFFLVALLPTVDGP